MFAGHIGAALAIGRAERSVNVGAFVSAALLLDFVLWLFAAAVFSHWLLDALVHVPELPLLGAHSTKVGLGLWQSMPVALVVEAGIVVAGLSLFLSGSSLPRTRKLALAALCLLALGFTVLGMTVAPAPPSAQAMAASSLATIAVVCALAFWLGRLRP